MRFRKSILYFSVLVLAMVQGMHADTVIGCVDVPEAYLSCEFYPKAIAITPNGLKAYVGNSDSVSVINLETNSVSDCVNVPEAYSPYCPFNNAWGIAITPNGQKAYVCNYSGYSVSVIDVETNSVIDCVNVPGAYSSCTFNAPTAIAITPNGEKAYVCNYNGYSVSVINLETNSVSGCVDTGAYSCVFNNPIAIAITPDGSKAYVCNFGTSTVSVIDVETDTVIDCVDGSYCRFDLPQAIAITPDGQKAYVGNYGTSTVSVIDVNTNTVIGCVNVPDAYSAYCEFAGLYAIAITGTKAYVCNASSVSVIDVNTDTVIGCVDVPEAFLSSCGFDYPVAIAITPDGSKAYVCNRGNRSVSIIGISPLAPTNLSGCILQQGITITNTLSWDAPTSGLLPTSYQIYRGSDLIATVPGYGYGPFEYEDAGLDANMTYTYSIYSVYDGITSNPATITLSVFCYPELFPPSAVTSSCSLDKNYTITWEVPTSGATPVEYEIYSDASLTHLVATVLAYGYDLFMYELTGLDPNMSYIYYIVSVDGYGYKITASKRYRRTMHIHLAPCISKWLQNAKSICYKLISSTTSLGQHPQADHRQWPISLSR